MVKKKQLYQEYYSNAYIDKATFIGNQNAAILIHKKITSVSFSSKKKVLDVACGIGLLGKTFSDVVYGFDLNPDAIKLAKKLGVKGKTGNVEKKWKYPNSYFDIVILSHIIEHVVNPDELIREAKRVLKKNGILIIVTPNLAAWFNRLLLLLGIQPFFTEVSTIDKTVGLRFTRRLTTQRNPLGHLRLFTKGAVIDLLSLHEFKITEVTGCEFGSFPWVLGIIDKIISQSVSLGSTLIVVARKINQ